MKTKTLLVLCLFLGIGLTQLSAQKKSVQYKDMNYEYVTLVFCDGVPADLVRGVVRVHVVIHYIGAEAKWLIRQLKGEVTSVGFDDANGNFIGGTGEVFKMSVIEKFLLPSKQNGALFHYNLNGNMGNHYIGSVFWSWDTWELIPGKTECN